MEDTSRSTKLTTTGIDLSNGAGIPELVRLQEHFSEYKLTVYQFLNCYIMFEGQFESYKRRNLLYDDVERYHVITNLTGAIARR